MIVDVSDHEVRAGHPDQLAELLAQVGHRAVLGARHLQGRESAGSREQRSESREQGAGSREQGAGSREQRAGSTGLPRSAEFLEYLSAVSLLCATASPPSRYILPRKAMALPADWRVKCGQQRQSDSRTVGIVGILETVKCVQQE